MSVKSERSHIPVIGPLLSQLCSVLLLLWWLCVYCMCMCACVCVCRFECDCMGDLTDLCFAVRQRTGGVNEEEEVWEGGGRGWGGSKFEEVVYILSPFFACYSFSVCIFFLDQVKWSPVFEQFLILGVIPVDASAAQSLESLNGAAEGLETSWGLLPEAHAWNLCSACPFGH